MYSVSKIQRCHRYSVYFAPRGSRRIYDLGIQIAQLYLSPSDRLIGFIGEAGSGKSMLVKGMFPGLELTNDDEGVNVRPLPILSVGEQKGFYSPHTYHLDIRFEAGFTQMHVLADAINEALTRGKRVIVEHFDLIYPFLKRNAHLLIGIGQEIIVTRPTLFGPAPSDIYDIVSRSLRIRQMAHTAEDLCERYLPHWELGRFQHDDVNNGFVLTFQDEAPDLDFDDIEQKVRRDIELDLPVSYVDENHVRIGDVLHPCTGPRTHVPSTGMVKNFRLVHKLFFDQETNRYLLVGLVGDEAEPEEDLNRIKMF